MSNYSISPDYYTDPRMFNWTGTAPTFVWIDEEGESKPSVCATCGMFIPSRDALEHLDLHAAGL